MVSEQPQRRSDTWMETTPHTGGPPRSETTGAGASAARPQSSSSPDIGATAQNIAQQTQETAGHVLDQAKEQATSRLTMQKDRAVESLGTVVEGWANEQATASKRSAWYRPICRRSSGAR